MGFCDWNWSKSKWNVVVFEVDDWKESKKLVNLNYSYLFIAVH